MPTSEKYLSVCQKCKALCCTLVLPPVTEEERKVVLDAGFDNYFTSIGDGIYSINPTDKGNCPYLKSDFSCGIQSVKPKLCKVWPVIPCYKNNKRGFIVIKCPIYPYLSNEDLEQSKLDAGDISLLVIEKLWDISEDTKKKYKVFEYEEI